MRGQVGSAEVTPDLLEEGVGHEQLSGFELAGDDAEGLRHHLKIETLGGDRAPSSHGCYDGRDPRLVE